MSKVKELAKDVYELNLAGLDYDERTPYIIKVQDLLDSDLPSNVEHAYKAVVGKTKLMGRDAIISIAQRTELHSEEPVYVCDVKAIIVTPGMQSSSVGMYLYVFAGKYDSAITRRIDVLREKDLGYKELNDLTEQIFQEEFETWWDNMVALLINKEK